MIWQSVTGDDIVVAIFRHLDNARACALVTESLEFVGGEGGGTWGDQQPQVPTHRPDDARLACNEISKQQQ